MQVAFVADLEIVREPARLPRPGSAFNSMESHHHLGRSCETAKGFEDRNLAKTLIFARWLEYCSSCV
jgi:hypothetical protein